MNHDSAPLRTGLNSATHSGVYSTSFPSLALGFFLSVQNSVSVSDSVSGSGVKLNDVMWG